MARKPGTKSVHMNQALKTILGEGSTAQRPDVTRVTIKNTVDMVEVPSAGQTRAQMENKLTTMRESIGKPGANIVKMPDPIGRTSTSSRMAPAPRIGVNGIFIPLIIIQEAVHQWKEIQINGWRNKDQEKWNKNDWRRCTDARHCL